MVGWEEWGGDGVVRHLRVVGEILEKCLTIGVVFVL